MYMAIHMCIHIVMYIAIHIYMLMLMYIYIRARRTTSKAQRLLVTGAFFGPVNGGDF